MRLLSLARSRFLALLFGLPALLLPNAQASAQDDDLPVIRRTEFGVPHIQARDFRGIGIGLGYAQTEDYGERVILSLLRAKGWLGRTFGRDSVERDFANRLARQRAVETYHLLDEDTRAVYEGFAQGVNLFIQSQPARVPGWAQPIFDGLDVAALDVGEANVAAAQRLVLRQLGRDSARAVVGQSESESDDGSNAWAFAPSRTRSGRAILLRNPHLAWTAGYWEAHVTVPGKVDFYGDFRIGGPFAVVGGFNRFLGFATTNNRTDTDEVYALTLHPWYPDHYILDGVRTPLQRREVTVEYRTDTGWASEKRTFWWTAYGPVVHRTRERIFVVRAASEGEFRAGEQFLKMMRAQNLAEWKAALAMRARPTSNFTYADRAGNILYVWNGSIPQLPHVAGGDSLVLPVRRASEMWSRLLPFDSLPQVLNPPGGYVHNENDAPYYANLNAILDTLRYPANVERPTLRLRSQHALELIHARPDGRTAAGRRKLTLQDVITLKHSPRMLLAERVKPGLLEAVRAAAADSSLLAAAKVLEDWDNTVAVESRGGVLFETWWRQYSSLARDSAYAEPWTQQELLTTPRGIGKPEQSVEALGWAAQEMQRRFGALDVAWGDVHRVRRGALDVPVAGCSGQLGCFRVLTFRDAPDGKRIASSGDGWVLAVEFTDTPRAYSILAYGQSPDPTSPHHADQAALFARGEMKPVRFTERDIRRHTVREYRPGK